MSTSSFIKGLTTSVLSNFSSYKRQVKRLQKESLRLVGRQLEPEECQEIVAAIHGYHRWSEISESAIRANADRSRPSYSILSRTDLHESLLSCMLNLHLDLDDSRPLVFLGNLNHAAMPAFCLWAETISSNRIPGLILVETSSPTIQATVLWEGIKRLGMEEIVSQFRIIDAREKNLPVSISATAAGWARSLNSTLSEKQISEFRESGGRHVLEQICKARGGLSGWGSDKEAHFPTATIKEALLYLLNPWKGALLSMLEGEERARLEHDYDMYIPRIPTDILQHFQSIYDSMSNWEAGLGTSVWHESTYRPTIVLFDRSNPLSHIVASAVYEGYFWRYANDRAKRPVLFFSDLMNKSVPCFLQSATNTAIVNGLDDLSSVNENEFLYGRSLSCSVNNSAIVFSGQSIEY
jgi:hypothetical protein